MLLYGGRYNLKSEGVVHRNMTIDQKRNYHDHASKIDPVFAAAAAAALNAGLVPGSTDLSNLTINASKGLGNNVRGPGSSATVAAVAAAAMNAAALAAALGGGFHNSSVDRLSQFRQPYYKGSYRQLSPSPPNRSYKRMRTDFNEDSRKFRSRRSRDYSPSYGNTNRYTYNVDHRNPEIDTNATRTLFIGNLPHEIRENDLNELFEKYGLIEDIDIKRSTTGTTTTPYAFVRFVNLDMAYRAKLDMSGKMIGQYTIKIGYGKVTPTRCLWIGGLGPWITYPAFAAVVNGLSSPEKIIWPSGKNYAHILYPTVDMAVMTANVLRGYPLGGGDRRIRVDFTDESHMIHDPLGAKRRMLSSGYLRQSRTKYYKESTGHYVDSNRRCFQARRSSRENRQDTIASKNRRYPSESPQRTEMHTPPASIGESGKGYMNASSPEQEKSVGRGYLSQRSSRSLSASDSQANDECKADLRASNKNHLLPSLETVTSIELLAACLPTAWNGVFFLKKASFACRMHILRGDEGLVDQFMPRSKSDFPWDLPSSDATNRGAPRTPPEDELGEEKSVKECLQLDTNRECDVEFAEERLLESPKEHVHASDESSFINTGPLAHLRITQRMKLDPHKLEDVSQRIRAAGNSGFCVLLAMPLKSDSDINQMHSQRPLRGLITYLSNKDAAGVVLLNPLQSVEKDSSKPEDHAVTGVLHVFPPSEFAFNLLVQRALSLKRPSDNENYLVILLIKSTGPL